MILYFTVLYCSAVEYLPGLKLASASSTTDSTITTTSASNGSLACYDCSESFKYVWDPYTECQAFPTTVPLRECLQTERYCKVERTTYRSMTVSITRSCTDNCWYGCHASGFGLTKLKCTSCCQGRACNIDNKATTPLKGFETIMLCLFTIITKVLC